MKKIGLVIREKITRDLKDKLGETEGCFFIGFNKLDAFSFNRLRNDLKDAGAQVFITKNSIYERSFNALGWKDFQDLIQDETGMVLVYDKDVVKSCKILAEFKKESEALNIKGAIVNEKKISAQDIDSMAKLPSKEVLLGMAVSGLASPLSGMVNSLNQIILKFVWALEEVKKTKDKK